MRKGEEKDDLETLNRSPLHHLSSLCLEARSWNSATCLTQASSFSRSQEICLCLASQGLLKHFGSLILSRDSPNNTFLSKRVCLLWAPVDATLGERRGARFLLCQLPAPLLCSGSCRDNYAGLLVSFPRSLSGGLDWAVSFWEVFIINATGGLEKKQENFVVSQWPLHGKNAWPSSSLPLHTTGSFNANVSAAEITLLLSAVQQPQAPQHCEH